MSQGAHVLSGVGFWGYIVSNEFMDFFFRVRLMREILSAFALLCAATSSQAATFDFRGTTGPVTEDGITAAVSAGGGVGLNSPFGPAVDQFIGLGVTGGTNGALNEGEELIFSFSETVTLSSASFYSVGITGSEVVSVLDSAGDVLTSVVIDDVGVPGQGYGSTSSALGLVGQIFRFTTESSGGGPGIRILSLDASAVPIPASLAFCLFGAGVLGFAAHRKSTRT